MQNVEVLKLNKAAHLELAQSHGVFYEFYESEVCLGNIVIIFYTRAFLWAIRFKKKARFHGLI